MDSSAGPAFSCVVHTALVALSLGKSKHAPYAGHAIDEMMAETPERLSDLDDEDKPDAHNRPGGTEAKSTGKACFAAVLAFLIYSLLSFWGRGMHQVCQTMWEGWFGVSLLWC